eukprot:TRINITY_DN2327_c0_g2_i13.p1 TRINITY_DN2327_c0_g2~~TRINITY_DN2327_c0_g2_i13.p1  ORF type:complete len:235 (+),score=31.32 TRINITY_DN2327_c0_g2_i13:70-774(+)
MDNDLIPTPLFPGEVCTSTVNCHLTMEQMNITDCPGLACLTNYKLYFKGYGGEVLSVPLNSINHITPLTTQRAGISFWGPPDLSSATQLLIRTKDLKKVVLIFVDSTTRIFLEEYLLGHSFWSLSEMKERLFAFQYKYDVEHQSKHYFYSVEKEFERLGLDPEQFVISDINQNYELCHAYPKRLILPRLATKEVLVGSSRFRLGGSLPTICWGNPRTSYTFTFITTSSCGRDWV